MPLSIRNSQVEQVARQVAALSGERITQSIFHALTDRLERLQGRRTVANLADEIMAISKRCRVLTDLDPRSPNEILGYDEHGV